MFMMSDMMQRVAVRNLTNDTITQNQYKKIINSLN